MGIAKRIGTPLSDSATRVMLLGCGELGKEVIIALQRLGCEVIGVDRYADAPGMQVAHRSHVVTMTDGAALRALIEKEKPDLVVPEIEAIATATLVEIEREGVAGHLPEVHTHRPRRAIDHEPRGDTSTGRRGTRAGHLALQVRRHAGRVAGRHRRRHRFSLRGEAGDVIVRAKASRCSRARPT